MPNEGAVALLPCPFCGGEAEMQLGKAGQSADFCDLFKVECVACGASRDGWDAIRGAAVADWNTRAAAMGWRDIASAPRDGTMFLGWHGGVGFWHWQDGTPPSRKTGWRNYMWVYPENEGPTHWMPLPTPPEPTT